MAKYGLFVLLVYLLQSCVFSNCEQKDLPQSEKEWTKPFKTGQKWVYTSNKDRVDTLTVLEVRDIYSPCNKLELGDYEFNQIDIRLKSNLLTKKTYGDIQFITSVDNEEGRISQLFCFIDLSDTYNDLNKEVVQSKVFVPKRSDSVRAYTFNQSNSKSEYEGIISSFSWSKKHGIVRYETKDGEVFELVKTI